MAQGANSSDNGGNGNRLYNQVAHKIQISDEMRDGCKVTDDIIAEAIAYLHQDGVLILENAINPSHLDDLETILGPEADIIANDPDHHFNFGKPHPLWPFAYAFNIPLCDTSVENGSTEIWIASHRDSNIDQHSAVGGGESGLTIKQDLLDERRQHSPPVQPTTKKGSLIIRDIRLWHAGMPNRTDKPRIMLAFVIQPRWFNAPSKVILPLRAKALVEQWKAETGLEYNATWVDGEVDHKKINSEEVDFSSRNKSLLGLEHMMHLPVH
ncbi:hypothetical protein LTR42_012319 [Elasticomyces elasticus]|nr:hypothetical protein LTR42_012319 [Elasticomyces elasticus]